MALGETIARLSVSLGLETAAFERGTKRATKEMSGFEKNMSRASKAVGTAFTAMLGAFAVDQIVGAAKRSLDFAASLGEVATQLGLTTRELQEYRFAATQTGIEQGEMEKGLAKLSRTIGEAASGNEKAAAMFDRLGISIRDSNGNVRATGDLLPEIADAYAKLGSAAEQSALSAEIFGSKLGQKLNPLLAEGSKGIAAYREEANRLGLVIDEAMIRNADEASDTIAKLENFISMKFTSTVAENSQAIGKLANDLIGLVSAIGSVADKWRYLELQMKKIDIWTQPLGSASWQERASDAASVDRQLGMMDGSTQRAARGRSNNRAQRRQRARALAPLAPAEWAAGTIIGGAAGRSIRGGGVTSPQMAPWQQQLMFGGKRNAVGGSAFGGTYWSQFTPGQGEGFIRMASAANDMVKPLGLADALFKNMATVNAPRLLATVKELTPAAEQMRGVTQSILDRLYPEEAEMRRYQEELAALNASLKAGELSTTDYARAVNDLRHEFDGFAQTIRENAEIVATGIGPTMDDLLDQADASWERFSTALIDQSARTRDQVVSNYLSLAAGVGDALGQLIGGKTGRIIGGIFNLIGQVAPLFGGARAEGGPVSAGRAYLVGERGPELVVPRTNGHVVPNHALGGGAQLVEIVDTTGLFKFRVNGQIRAAAPSIANAGAAGGMAKMKRSGSRRVA